MSRHEVVARDRRPVHARPRATAQVDGSTVQGSMRHQDRDRHVRKDLARDAAKQALAHGRVGVATITIRSASRSVGAGQQGVGNGGVSDVCSTLAGTPWRESHCCIPAAWNPSAVSIAHRDESEGDTRVLAQQRQRVAQRDRRFARDHSTPRAPAFRPPRSVRDNQQRAPRAAWPPRRVRASRMSRPLPDRPALVAGPAVANGSERPELERARIHFRHLLRERLCDSTRWCNCSPIRR